MNEDIKLEIFLPPGLLPRQVVREVLRLVFDEFRWFKPVRYGFADFDRVVLPGEIGIDGMLAYYEEDRHLWVSTHTENDYIFISPARRDDEERCAGTIGWSALNPRRERSDWSSVIVDQVKQLMILVRSPFAFIASRDDWERKSQYLVEREVGSEEVYTVRRYNDGLAGLFWRNFYGPPFVRMFGERLRSLPPGVRTDLGEELVLVEPYPSPEDAETQEGKARERAIIELLGPECFYDHQRHVMPTRRPDPADLPAPIGILLPPRSQAGEV